LTLFARGEASKKNKNASKKYIRHASKKIYMHKKKNPGATV
jgi:hypothetical protein